MTLSEKKEFFISLMQDAFNETEDRTKGVAVVFPGSLDDFYKVKEDIVNETGYILKEQALEGHEDCLPTIYILEG